MAPSLEIAESPAVRGVAGHDFSGVTSPDEVQRLVAVGRLRPALLFPAELGGTETPENTVYVPCNAAQQLRQVTAEVLRIVGTRYAVTVDVLPERRGRSLVPWRIRVQAGLVASANAFEWVIEIW